MAASPPAQEIPAEVTAGTPSAADALTPSRLREQLSETVRDTLPATVLVLAGLYLLFAVINRTILPPHIASQLTVAAASTAVVLTILGLALYRWSLPVRLAQPATATIALIVLSEILYHLSLRPGPSQTAGLSMLMVGVGCVLLSWPLLAAVLAAAVAGWASVMFLLEDGNAWTTALYLLCSAVVLSVLIHGIRMKTLSRLLQISAQDQMLRKEMEHALTALQRSERRFRRLFDSGLIGVVYSDFGGRLTDANDRFLEIVGRTRADLPLRWDEMTPPEWADGDEICVRDLRETGLSEPWEKEYYHSDGHRVPILLGVARLDDATDDCIGFVLDLTEAKQTQARVRSLTVQLERAARQATIGEMVAGLAHELHQPLAASINLVRALRRKSGSGTLPEDELQEVLGKVESHAMAVSQMLRGIGESVGEHQPVPVACSLRGCIDPAIDLTTSATRCRPDLILADIPRDLPLVMADGVQLTHALFCLLMNAVHSVEELPEDKRVVVVSAAASGKRKVRVEVLDNGTGILPEHMAQIFHQFFSTRDAPGLGLSIARTVVEAHGSRLAVKSTPGEGSVFSFELPVAPAGAGAVSWTGGSLLQGS